MVAKKIRAVKVKMSSWKEAMVISSMKTDVLQLFGNRWRIRWIK